MPMDITKLVGAKTYNGNEVEVSGGINLKNFDKVSQKACGEVEDNDELKLDFIKSQGARINRSASHKTYKVICSGKLMKTSSFIDLLRGNNEDAIFYDEDLDDDPLIHMTEKPLWAVKKVGNSFKISRTN